MLIMMQSCADRATMSLVLLWRVFAVLKKAAAHGTVNLCNLAEFARTRSSRDGCGLMCWRWQACSQTVAGVSR